MIGNGFLGKTKLSSSRMSILFSIEWNLSNFVFGSWSRSAPYLMVIREYMHILYNSMLLHQNKECVSVKGKGMNIGSNMSLWFYTMNTP